MAKKPADKKDGPVSPWLKGTRGIRGIFPPGRRLGDANERRVTSWSATGVKGVTPPGRNVPGKVKAKAKAKAKDATASKTGKNASAKAGRRVNISALADPTDLKAFLEHLVEFARKMPSEKMNAIHLAQAIDQSHAPFEIVVAFTFLSTIVGNDASMRRRYASQLERGAKTFYNLSIRLDKKVKPPRGLVPETVDALFHDLPELAYRIPYAFAAHATVRIVELLRTSEVQDAEILEFAEGVYDRYIRLRSVGDQPLSRIFPWEPPDWALGAGVGTNDG